MKILKIIVLVVLLIVSIPLIVGLFVKKDYSLEREVIINQPKSEVFDYLKYLKNQENFSKWSTMDPDMKKEFTGTDGMVGFVSSWESENPNVGKGEQEIVDLIDGERIDYELRFIEPFESRDRAYLMVESVSQNQTKVVWGFKGRMDYPLNTMLLFMDMEEMLGADFEEGLNNLKNILE